MKTDLVVAGYLFHGDKLLLIHHKKLDLWLPVGGHIDENEIPDEALKREFKEEVDLDIEIIKRNPIQGHAIKSLSVPFHVEIHNVGDHDHCCFFYLCKTRDNNVAIKPDEVKDFKWFGKEEINQDFILEDVRDVALRAFELLEHNPDN